VTGRPGAIYLDWNATTPPHPEVIAAMQEGHRTAWANPSSVHGAGREARACVDDAREAVARLVRMHPRDVILTSGGTEANNLAVTSAFAGEPGALVASRVEHPSVVRAVEELARRGVHVTWVVPEPSGRVAPEAVREAIAEAARHAPVRLVTLQAVNHETGVIQPVSAVAELAHAVGARLHVDAVQAVGRLEPRAWEGADLVTLAAHKFRGPKGIGAVVTAPGVRLRPILLGGAQERGLRPGTQDAAACAGLAVAARLAQESPARYAPIAELRDRLETDLVALGRRLGASPIRNGDAPRAPHVTNLSWPGHRGDELCAALDLEGLCVSSGSACSAGTAEPSPVVLAMSGAERASSAVRISLGEGTSLEEISAAVACFERVLMRAPGARGASSTS
jgi:cysteine desulfurase